MPRRIQRKRTPGWRMPKNTIYVGRPTKWGNPYTVKKETGLAWRGCWGVYNPDGTCRGRYTEEDNAKHRAIQLYQWMLEEEMKSNPGVLAELSGKDLACWCRIDYPCHCDVLIELANSAPAD